jgi:hypothetical protein
VVEGCTRRSGRVGRDGLARHCLFFRVGVGDESRGGGWSMLD